LIEQQMTKSRFLECSPIGAIANQGCRFHALDQELGNIPTLHQDKPTVGSCPRSGAAFPVGCAVQCLERGGPARVGGIQPNVRDHVILALVGFKHNIKFR